MNSMQEREQDYSRKLFDISKTFIKEGWILDEKASRANWSVTVLRFETW